MKKLGMLTWRIFWIILISCFIIGSLDKINEPGSFSIVKAQSGTTNHPVFLPLISQTINTPTIFGSALDSFSTGSGFYQLVAARTSWTRRDYSWAAIEPAQGQRNWSALSYMESDFVLANNYGMKIVLVVGDTPKWALKPGFICGAVAPSYLAAFGQFMYDLVSRYSVQPYNIKYWELWNEPDVRDWLGCWGLPGDKYYGGGYYAQMLKAAYPMIKAADPSAQVLVGGLLLDCDPNNPPPDPTNPSKPKDCTPARFLEGILSSGGGNYFDAVSMHAYDYYQGNGAYYNPNWHTSWNNGGPALNNKTNYIRGLLSLYKVPNKAILDTELALLCDACTPQSQSSADFENTKANYIVESYSDAINQKLLANIWYTTMGWRNSGLLASGQKQLPGFQAYYFTSETLAWASSLGQVTPAEMGVTGGVTGLKFTNYTKKETWVLWALDAASHSVSFARTPSRIMDAYGNPIPAGTTISLTKNPVFVQWDP